MSYRRPQSEDELVELVSSIDVQAPATLRSSVERMLADAPIAPRSPAAALLRRALPVGRAGLGAGRASRSRSRSRGGLAGGLAAAALASVIVALVLATSGGTASLSLRSAAAPTLLASTTPAPRERDHSHFLAAAVDGVRFPYWEESFGWRSTGARHDTFRGRPVTTVFYRRGHSTIGYAIYSGVPSSRPSGGVVRWQNGTAYDVTSDGGTAIISWLHSGHLCVMSGHYASAAALMRLASWGEGATRA
jgi:hypothetical protein